MSHARTLLALIALSSMPACGDQSSPPGNEMPQAIDCEQPSLPDTEVIEQFIPADPIPSGQGGPLQDGDYELTEHIRYRAMTSPAETPTSMRAALRLRSGAKIIDYAFAEDASTELDGVTEITGFTAGVTTSGNQLHLSIVCPDTDDTLLTYTASGSNLSIFEENEELRFERR